MPGWCNEHYGSAMKRLFSVIAVTVVLACWFIACARRSETPTATTNPPDALLTSLGKQDPTTWVRRFRPEKASSGFNLVLYHRRLPILLDMNGNIVHMWPTVRAVARARLNREGRLLVLARGNRVEEYDWDGNLTWYFELPRRDLTHHDLIQLANDNYLVLAVDQKTHRNYLTEVDHRRTVVWQWWAQHHLADHPGWDPASLDPAHLNSINELPPNRWFDAGDDRFRPGNILVSARNLNTIFVIDRSSGEIVWRYSDGLDSQHEAKMVEKGRLGAGLITVFNNGFNNLFAYRRSSVEAINPIKKVTEWKYSSDYFFSGTGGTACRLEGGTTLVNSTYGHRIFEIDSRGEILWEMIPPGPLGRAERVPYNHCPHLRAMARPVETEVQPDHWGPYVDADLYAFEPGNRFGRKTVAKKRRKLLPWGDACRDLLFPPGASMGIGCGIVEDDLGGESLSARFELSITPEGGPEETLLDVSIDESSKKTWQWFNLRLHRFAYQRARLCVATEVDGSLENPERMVAWAYPIIKSKWQTPEFAEPSQRVNERERRLRQQQLEAIGYIE